jgi:uncharacterized RDD family membrane protein YckC
MSPHKPQRFGDLEPSHWPGERLGLSENGPGSVARLGRRTLAIVIDWAIAMVIANGFFADAEVPIATLLVFAAAQIIFIPTIGGSPGHRILGLRIISLTGDWVGFWRPVVRTLLLILVIPVLVWDSDHRGFHDKVAGTTLIRSPDYAAR